MTEQQLATAIEIQRELSDLREHKQDILQAAEPAPMIDCVPEWHVKLMVFHGSIAAHFVETYLPIPLQQLVDEYLTRIDTRIEELETQFVNL